MKNIKRSYSSTLVYLFITFVFIMFFLLNLYSYINNNDIKSLVTLFIFAGLLVIDLFLLFINLFAPSTAITFYKDYFIVFKVFSKKIVRYDEVFTTFSGIIKPNVLLESYLLIYLKNGDIIKVKHLKNPQAVKLIFESYIGNKNYYIQKENKLYKFFVRCFNLAVSFSQRFMNFKTAKELENLDEVVKKYKEKGLKHVFVISFTSPLVNDLLNKFKEEGIETTLSNFKIKNPTNELILKLKDDYLSSKCDSILAIGGGSKIDAAKALGVILNNKKDLEKYSGLFKVKHNIPFLIAIPTIPASGSETTIASVISYSDKKCSIMSNRIVPKYTYLGKEYLEGVKGNLLAYSTLDALTHAIEAYLNVFKNKKYDETALKAIKLIYENIENAYDNEDINSKVNLLKASYLAGIAFSFKGVGNVHALSHALSYKYNLEHAKTNGIILPQVLKTYLYNKTARKKMSNIAIYLNLSSDKKDIKNNALLTLKWIESLVKKFDLNVRINEININDVKFLAKHAKKEANPLYATPITYTFNEYCYMYLNLKNHKED